MSDYHGRIMNIQSKNHGGCEHSSGLYRLGHRDARHAAAEIANEAACEIDRLRAEGERLREALLVAEKALGDLGACDDPSCSEPNCARALLRVRAALEPQP